ncbi:NAD(P)H-dependent oxidoreductase [Photobacterium aphoticum]|uniref:Potassium transporter KefG n=1 Tax=Photobacterium aphoticum TaxID=754436 RepID=A0A0J1GNG4_9GAMM|nr:NAD(P)H-dependent oxidoreductase [Photobacterium aphoticum]KLV01151.1 potassium transporter KefG [Photobacterium aphoticum]PSU55446.1 potassium transporter KefG [Photobacterium aphoticum]GHA49219.1 potassium transporter KefG [Photobacterium aphoticum]
MSGIKNKILILFAHPSPARSEVNFPLLKASQQLEGITVVDLYHEYPTFRINIDREQQRLRDHDVIIFMFPLYWYSTPSILKEWQDLVLEYGFAYGSEGTALHGKTFFCALTAGGPESAYCAEGYNHYTLKELLQPLEQTAILTGMEFWAPFALFNARMAVEEKRVEPHVADWLRLLRAVKTDRIDRDAARRVAILNKDLDSVIREAQ